MAYYTGMVNCIVEYLLPSATMGPGNVTPSRKVEKKACIEVSGIFQGRVVTKISVSNVVVSAP